MAEKKGAKPEEAKPEGGKTAAAPAKGSKKSRLLMIIAIAVVVLGAGGGGAWWYFSRGHDGEEATVKAPPALPPVFVPLEAFTVNLQPGKDGTQQYMQIGITLKMAGQPVADAIKDQMPEIRSRLLLALSAKKAAELLSPEGKHKLAEELMVEVVKVIDPETAKKILAAAQAKPPVSVAAAAPETKTDAAEQKPEDAPAEADASAQATDAQAEAEPAENATAEAGAGTIASPVLSVLFTSFIIQ